MDGGYSERSEDMWSRWKYGYCKRETQDKDTCIWPLYAWDEIEDNKEEVEEEKEKLLIVILKYLW